MITVLAVGKKHEDWIESGVKRYETRLRKPFDIKWQLIAHSALEEHRARQEESERLLMQLKSNDYVILLDETGDMLDSPSLSKLLSGQFTSSRPVVIVIGGAYGVDDRIIARADKVWSVSELVFPHQLVRLILVEQIYRSLQIAEGGRYHHK